jgi:uncharacterized SAM-binding protein YcdF (DUF218 family)
MRDEEYDSDVLARIRKRRIHPAAVGVAVALLLITLGGRFLRAVAFILIAEDPLEPADAIVLTVDSGPAGVREAAALVRRGIATRVAVFEEASSGDAGRDADAAERFKRRLDRLAAFGIRDVVALPAVRGTTEEGPTLARWSRSQGLKSVVVVSLPDHSRRVRRVLRRAFRDSPTNVRVKVAPYGLFEPDTWWREPTGIRIVSAELAKLVVDVALHPFS